MIAVLIVRQTTKRALLWGASPHDNYLGRRLAVAGLESEETRRPGELGVAVVTYLGLALQ